MDPNSSVRYSTIRVGVDILVAEKSNLTFLINSRGISVYNTPLCRVKPCLAHVDVDNASTGIAMAKRIRAILVGWTLRCVCARACACDSKLSIDVAAFLFKPTASACLKQTSTAGHSG